jgi:peptidoglycan pentaglycine glycine transferase (the first glycine)
MIHFKIEQQKEWDAAISKSPDGGLLQFWTWGRFQESLGNAVYNISNDDKTWFAQCVQLKAGNHWIISIPRGPVYSGEGKPDKKSFENFLSEIKEFATKRNAFMVRFDAPYNDLIPRNSQIKIKKSKKVTNPEHTLILDTTESEKQLLANMKPKWRYNVNLAPKKGVTTRWGWKTEDAETFAKLMAKTTDRQDFASYDEAYFKKLVTFLAPIRAGSFVFAELEGKVIAGLLLTHFGAVTTYLHGASDYEYRKLMAPHLLQWEAIKDAKKNDSRYDFWGVAADPPANKAEKHWGGVTRFKKGFAPNTAITEYMGTYEIPVQRLWYLAYRLRTMLKK